MIKVLKLDFFPPEDQIVKQGSLKVLVISVVIVGFFTVWVETVSLELLGTLVLWGKLVTVADVHYCPLQLMETNVGSCP